MRAKQIYRKRQEYHLQWNSILEMNLTFAPLSVKAKRYTGKNVAKILSKPKIWIDIKHKVGDPKKTKLVSKKGKKSVKKGFLKSFVKFTV